MKLQLHIGIVLLTGVVVGFSTGCGDSTSAVNETTGKSAGDALAWFDELSRRATQRDADFVRSSARTHVLSKRPATKTNNTSSDPAVALCDALMFSQPLESAATSDPNRIMISAAQYSAGVFGGSAWEYTIDLYREKDGWKIDSWPYSHRTLSASGRPNATATAPKK